MRSVSEKSSESLTDTQNLPPQAAEPRRVPAESAPSVDALPELEEFSPELSAVIRAFRGERAPINCPKHPQPVSVSSLEMLEAELANQMIVPTLGEHTPSIAQAAAFEANLLQWRARRFGISGTQIQFQIDLGRYVGYLAVELIQLHREMKLSPAHLLRGHLSSKRLSWRAIFPSDEIVRSTLQYLDRFAKYLLADDETAEGRFQRGLNLVLKVLADGDSESRATAREALGNTTHVVLPVITRDYLTRLRAQTSRSTEALR